MRYASVCDGIGAAHVAWQPLGWQCEWTAEIDAFPSAVVEQRWGFPNRGDMTRFKEWDDAPIDLLVGGTPCQSFSVAGLRKGLHDPRGGLMLTFLEIAQRYRPRWVVWENVPGVLSSNGGRDFGSFLGALGELGYGWAYRVLDAQWFGVAQRRRRVFVVGCLGDERRAAQVLFESESVRRDNPPSRAKGEGATVAASSGTGGGGEPIWRGGDQANSEHCVGHAGTLKRDKGQQGGIVAMPQAFYSNESRCDNIPPPDISPPVKVGSSGSGNPPAVAFSHSAAGNSHGIAYVVEGTPPIRGGGAGNSMPAVAYTKSKRAQSTTDDESWVPGEVRPTMSCFDQGDTRATTVVAQPAIGFDGFQSDNPKATHQATIEGTGPLIRARPHCVATAMAVRRLTPRECERLQGFPDDYTAIEYRKKPAADGPRYKALGNSMAVPVMAWIGQRIEAAV